MARCEQNVWFFCIFVEFFIINTRAISIKWIAFEYGEQIKSRINEHTSNHIQPHWGHPTSE